MPNRCLYDEIYARPQQPWVDRRTTRSHNPPRRATSFKDLPLMRHNNASYDSHHAALASSYYPQKNPPSLVPTASFRRSHRPSYQKAASARELPRLYPSPDSVKDIPDAKVSFSECGWFEVGFEGRTQTFRSGLKSYDYRSCPQLTLKKPPSSEAVPPRPSLPTRMSSKESLEFCSLRSRSQEDHFPVPSPSPSSRGRRKQQQQQQRGIPRRMTSWHHPQDIPEIEIEPGVSLPIRSSQETLRAINNGNHQAQELQCLVCDTTLICVKDATFVICPDCRSISPMPCKAEFKSRNDFFNTRSTVAVGLRKNKSK